ncbi:MAG: hypothetical protein U9P37_03110 [Pseudomonadota bacterium]|nr:hypothetical protein [Pseudomonadota bacterium]
MKWIKMLLAFGTIFSLIACGHVVKETVIPVPVDQVKPAGKKVVVVPFADYTPRSSQKNYWRRNVLVMEALQDEFARFGLMTAIEEDVVRYLMDEKIIEPPEVFFGHSPMNEYMRGMTTNENWSVYMTRELEAAISHNEQVETERQRKKKGKDQQGLESASLTGGQVIHLGNTFGADYIIRGRLIEFDQGAAKGNFNPFQVGILPFVFNTGQRAIFGVAKSEKYEMIDKMAIGGIAGLTIGSNNDNEPFDEEVDHESGGHPLFDPTVTNVKDYHELNTVFWGAAGTGLAFLAHKGGKVPRAVVQIRIMVQDALTGALLWTNRSQVEVVPKSVYSPQEYRVLVAKAIKEAAGSLVNNFMATIEPRLTPVEIPDPDKHNCETASAS